MDRIGELARELHGAKSESDLRSLLATIAAVAEEPDGDTEVEGLLYLILEREERIALALATWVDGAQGQAAANALIRHCSVRFLMADNPAPVDLRFVSPEEASKAVQRMNRWVATPAFVLGWILGILRRWPEHQGAFEACDRVLYYLMCEFPGPVHRLIATVRSEAFSARVQQLLAHYRDQLAEDEERLQSFPWLAEFELSGREAEVLRIHRQRTNDEIIGHAEEHSIFAKFATRFRFKYSQRVVLPTAEGETALEMCEMRAEAPFPLSEWSDPLEGIRHRNELWKEGET